MPGAGGRRAESNKDVYPQIVPHIVNAPRLGAGHKTVCCLSLSLRRAGTADRDALIDAKIARVSSKYRSCSRLAPEPHDMVYYQMSGKKLPGKSTLEMEKTNGIYSYN